MVKAEATKAPEVYIAHATEGRARLRATGALGVETLTGIADQLAALPGVTRVVVRPNTGSLIVEAALQAEALCMLIETSGAVRIVAPAKPPQVGKVVKLGFFKLDHEIRAHSDDALSLRSALALLLFAGAFIQLVRGNVAGPATALLVSALSLIEPPKD